MLYRTTRTTSHQHKGFLPSLLLLISLSIFSFSAYAKLEVDKLTLLSPMEQQRTASVEIINQLRLSHYRYLSIDNDFSSLLLDKYIDDLDPNRSYFLQADIEEFENYRYALDNALNKGDLEPAFTIFNLYLQRVEERLLWLLSQLETGVEDINLESQESLELDREEAPWLATDEAMSEHWYKRYKNAVLGLRLADKDNEQIVKTLTRRYQNQLNRLRQNTSEDVFQTFMNAVAKCYDPHTEFFAPRRSENFNINMSLSLEGIGAVLQLEDEFTKVVRLIPGGPAEKSELLQPADRIVGVAQDEDGEMEDVVGWRLDEVVELIRGPKDSIVRLQIIPASAVDETATQEIRIVRQKILLEEQAAQKKVIDLGRGDDSYKIGIIEVPAFYADFEAYQAGDPNYKSTTRDVKKLLEELKAEQVDGIVVDLRNNGGGSLSEANSMVGLFIETGATVQIRNSRNRVRVLADNDPTLVYNGPLAVVINRLSASASEIFAGAIQDYGRGLVLGSRTFGKGTVQSVLPLSEGQLKVTQQKFYRISGASTQNEGVRPDILFPPAVDPEELGESALEEALPWDTIRPVLFKKLGSLDPLINELNVAHEERSKMNPDYQFMVSQINRSKELRNRKSISLNITDRQEERDANKAEQLEMENQRRLAKGLEEVASLDDVKDEEFDDPYLTESGEILVDYIRLLDRKLAQNNQ